MMQGYNLEDVARGIDEMMIRQPLGVVAAIVPFNFPGMIPFWFLPYAIATGNTFVLKPSERVPLTMRRAFELLEKIGLPKGVVNLVNGGKAVVNALLDHPKVRAISFVGSTPVARYVYARAGAREARAMPGRREESRHRVAGRRHEDDHADHRRQRFWLCRTALPGRFRRGDRWRSAKNFSRFDYRGGRLAASGEWSRRGRPNGAGDHAAEQGSGRIADRDRRETGRKSLLDGRNSRIPKGEAGNFVKPTVLDGVSATSELTDTEIFGPVLSLVHANDMDEALAFLERSPYGNQASLFTSSGAAARRFRYEAPAGNIGINIGVAAPMAYFPFSGWKDSFFGIMHAQGRDAIEFYTEKKIVVERWAKDHSRKF